jgi:hypothetical protein
MAKATTNKSKKRSKDLPNLSNQVLLDDHQKIGITSIVIIFICLTIAAWALRQQKLIQSLSLSPSPENYIQLSSNLKQTQPNNYFEGFITATSSNPKSILFLSLSQLPHGITADCYQLSAETFTDTCTIFGSPTNTGTFKILATVLDRHTQSQKQQWFPLTISNSTDSQLSNWFRI